MDNPIAHLPFALKIPLLSSFQPTRLSYVTTFGLSIFATVGLERFWRFTQKDWKIIAVPTVMIAGIFATLVVTSSKFSSADRLVSQRNLAFPVILFVLSLIGMVCMLLTKTRRQFSLFPVSCFLFLIVADLFRFGWKFTPFSPVQYLYPVTSTIQFLQSHMGPNDRLMTLDRRILPPNANIMYRLSSMNGYDPIYSKDYALKITEMESGRKEKNPANFGRIVVPMNYDSSMTSAFHVRYLLTLSELTDSVLTKVFQEGDTRVYKFTEQ